MILFMDLFDLPLIEDRIFTHSFITTASYFELSLFNSVIDFCFYGWFSYFFIRLRPLFMHYL